MLKRSIKNNRILRAILHSLIWLKERITEKHGRRKRWDKIVGGEIVLSVDNVPGHFKLSATSDLAQRIILNGSYEPEVTESLKQFADIEGVIVDVGANIGLYAAYFAQACGKAAKVVAIEANPEAYKYLIQNIDGNGLTTKVETVNACIGAERKVVEFAYVAGKPEYSSVEGIVHPAIRSSEVLTMKIPQIPLDEVVSEQSVSLIFVDVEGAEEYVFRGAEKILREMRPILFFECSDILLSKFGGSSKTLVKFLNDLGYRVTNPLAGESELSYPYEGEAIARYIGL